LRSEVFYDVASEANPNQQRRKYKQWVYYELFVVTDEKKITWRVRITLLHKMVLP